MKKIKSKRRLTTICAFAALAVFLAAGAAVAAAKVPTVGMITRLKGDVTYANAAVDAQTAEARSFMKMRKGDEYTLSDGAEVQLIYFSGGRKETWKGPAAFKVGDGESAILGEAGEGGGPLVAQLPANVAKEVKRVSPLVDPERLHRSGSSMVRGSGSSDAPKPRLAIKLDPDEQAEVDAAKKTYETLLESTPPDDITPELFLFSVMADFDQYEEMKTLIGAMRKKQPDNDGIDNLETWMKDQF